MQRRFWSITISLTATSIAGGTAAGEIMLSGTLLATVNLSSAGNTDAISGRRSGRGQAAVNGLFDAQVIRQGVSANLTINVDLMLFLRNNNQDESSRSPGIRPLTEASAAISVGFSLSAHTQPSAG